MSTRYLLIAILIFVVSALAGYRIADDSIWRLQGSIASRGWPSADGRIGGSDLYRFTDQDGTDYVAFIQYTYLIAGREYLSHLFSFSGTSGYDQASLVDEYPVGRSVTVYYNPAHPSTAVLVPGRCIGCSMHLVFGASLPFSVSLICYLLYRLVRAPRKVEKAPAGAPEASP